MDGGDEGIFLRRMYLYQIENQGIPGCATKGCVFEVLLIKNKHYR